MGPFRELFVGSPEQMTAEQALDAFCKETSRPPLVKRIAMNPVMFWKVARLLNAKIEPDITVTSIRIAAPCGWVRIDSDPDEPMWPLRPWTVLE